MDRSRRLYELWTWLVPFRAVAETESLPAAAAQLRIAPSALSRSVKLLESRLEVALFERRSQRLVLNPAGHRLLAALRTAMRVIDDSIVDVIADAGARTVRIACPGELLPLVVAPLAALAAAIPAVSLAVDEPADGDVAAALRRGVIDVAVVAARASADALVVRPLGSFPRAVFAAAAAPPSPLRFAIAVDRDGAPRDPPPPAGSAIGLRARHGAAIVEAVRSGGMAAVLVDAVGRGAGFCRLDLGVALAPVELAIVTRPALVPDDLAERVADQLCAALARA